MTKAFDPGNRDRPWEIMLKLGCPERFTQIVRQLHDGMMARVRDNRAVSEAFAVTNGVKKGCVLAPTLLSLMFSGMLVDAYCDERLGIRIAYRTDGHLLNHRWMHFQSRVSTTTVHELLFADDCVLNATSEEDMQRSMDLFSAACENFDLIINTEKTVVMHQPPPDTAHNASCTYLATPKPNRPQRVLGIGGHSGRQLDFLDTFGPTTALTAPTVVSPSTSPSPSTQSTNSDRPPEPTLPSCASSSTAAVASATHINITHNPDKPKNTNTTIADTRGEDLDYTCSHCDRTFTSHIGLVGHLRIHRTNTGEPVPGAPTYTRRIRFPLSTLP
ncbi:hypothetical protein SprV_0200925100 [Sparganum proliferum]